MIPTTLLLFFIFLLPGCGVSVRKDWQVLQNDVLTRTGYMVDLDGRSYESSPNSTLLTKEQAIEQTLMSNPELHAYFQELGIAKSDLVQAGLYKNPEFTSAINFPKSKEDTNEVDIGFVLSLSDAWQLPVRKKVASYNLEVISLLIINTILSTIADVEHAYIACNYLQEVLALRINMYKQASLLVEELEYRQQFGLQSDFEINLANAFMQQSYAQILTAENNLAIANSTLRKLLGAKPTLDHIEVDHIIITQLPSFTYDELYQYALQRPDILAAEYRIKQFEKLIDLERRRFIDNMSIGISWSKDFERAKGAGPLLAIELPIFNMNQAQIARAQFGCTQAERRLTAKQLEVTHDLNSAFSHYKTAQNRLSPLSQALDQQKQALEYTYRFFITMQIKLPLLIEARLDLLHTELTLLQTYYEAYSAYIDLQKIVGRRLSKS